MLQSHSLEGYARKLVYESPSAPKVGLTCVEGRTCRLAFGETFGVSRPGHCKKREREMNVGTVHNDEATGKNLVD